MQRELNFAGSLPLLYLIATPIGNLSEMTPRAIEVISKSDYVACEDTRNSGELLSHFNLKKPLISCHSYNENEAAAKIVGLIKEGKSVCYMSDAGYPTISDPGKCLVRQCLENGIKVSIVSGPSAAMDALVCSGLDATHFFFQGFLPTKAGERDKELTELSLRRETIVFYEAPHRIGETLQALLKIFGAERKAAIARELTKTHEEFIRGTLSELSIIDPSTIKGEIVIVVEGSTKAAHEFSDEDLLSLLTAELKNGSTPKDAVSSVSKESAAPKNRVYALFLSITRK